MLTERDWVMRLVKQLADFIARALKLASEQRREEALEVLRQTCSTQLGMEYEVLSMLDAAAAVDLLGEPSRALAFVQLVDAMAEVEQRCNEPLRAEARRRHADELCAAIVQRWPRHAETQAWLGARGSGKA
ncbi:MAG: hypothetical protein AB1938_21210 [Myxococcota bacterium]